MLDTFYQFLSSNKEWIFSGIGVAVISVILGLFFKTRSSSNQSIRSGGNSTNIQAGQDVHINKD